MDTIEAAVHCGIERAADRAAPILVSICIPVDGIEPLVSFGAINEPVRAFWRSATHDESFACFGLAWQADIDNATKFVSASEQIRSLAESAVVEAPDDIPWPWPRLAAGFSFDTPDPLDEVWSGFPVNRVMLPAAMLSRGHGATWITVNMIVEALSNAQDIASAANYSINRLTDSRMIPADTSVNLGTLRSRNECPSREQWGGSVRAITDEISRGVCEKAVLARRLDLTFNSNIDISAVVANLCARYPEATVIASGAGTKTFVCASPERLAGLRGGLVESLMFGGFSAPFR